ncbi:MAG: C45 family autoproteolytic acyltransferase/hydrolase [Sphingobacterium sp.]
MLRFSVLVATSLLLVSACRSPKIPLSLNQQRINRVLVDSPLAKTDFLMRSGDDYMVKNDLGNWELYVHGSPEVIGTKIGLLSRDLYRQQEEIFASKLFELVPSRRKQKRIMRFLSWYNRKLDKDIPQEYLKEIYTLSNFLDTTYNYLGSPYQRTLWMHGAHDIGHVLEDLAMVGCSSFAVWGGNTRDGKLLVARNLDFYMNDDFAKQKVIYFVKPDEGYPYVSVSWPGMIGVLSGMNRQGLTITLNAGKSSIPWSARTPISIVAREVLQYAANIQQAVEILKRKKVFVSESLMISSAYDEKAVLVEITPRKIDVVEATGSRLLSTNHFQGKLLGDDSRNRKNIHDSHSFYRFEKLQSLLDTMDRLTPERAASILRNTDGQHCEKLGLGNDKSLNHMLAHHGIIFQPEDRLVYVSSAPGQMGAFKAYDLKEIFDKPWQAEKGRGIDSLAISADPLVASDQYADFKVFRRLSASYLDLIDREDPWVSARELQEYIDLNPDLWLGYYVAGRLFYLQKDYPNAEKFYSLASGKVLPSAQIKTEIQRQLKKATKRWKER